jgi:type I restriction enzyme S subunit
MEFKQYPSYKKSGVEWLGGVPEHWVGSKFKYIFQEKQHTKNMNLPFGAISFGSVVYKEDKANLTDELKENYQEVLQGEFLVNPLNLNYDLKSLRTALSKIDVVVSSGYFVLKLKNNTFNKRYLEYLLYIFDIRKMKTLGAGIRQTLTFRDMAVCDVAIPSACEQTQIASFLDYETFRIDNLIAKQEKLIELLEEQRKSIISHAVTKGLNPNAPMKDSGVEWLGEVPEHWEVFQLKSAIKGWRNGKWGNEPAAENNICCVRVADFDRTKGVINTTKLTYRNYHGENISECILDENSILIERSGGGEKQLVGATVVNTLKQTAVCSNFISLLNINPNRVNIFFLQKCFENLYTRKVNEKSIKQTSGIQNLDLKQYLQNNIAYPSLDEQKSIVSYLDAECKKIDLLVDKQYQLIRKLKNYRTSIISHAVTGKIDVREFGT